VLLDRWRLAGWQCAVSAHWAGGWRDRVVLALSASSHNEARASLALATITVQDCRGSSEAR